jgi:outer membrane protein OmpA-like peptidoglycan-associated protein
MKMISRITGRIKGPSILMVLFFISQSLGILSAQDLLRYDMRADLRLRENGRYAGFRVFEDSALLYEQEPEVFEGSYWRYTGLIKDGLYVSRPIDAEYQVVFGPSSAELDQDQVRQFPRRRGFPVIPEDFLETEVWQAYGEIVLDTQAEIPTIYRFLCEYRYMGREPYGDQMVDVIEAQYALRYKRGMDPRGDFSLERVDGSHKVRILLFDDGTLFMRDQVQEQWRFSDGDTKEVNGFFLTWVGNTFPMNRNVLNRSLADYGVRNIASDDEVGNDLGDDGTASGEDASGEDSKDVTHIRPKHPGILDSEDVELVEDDLGITLRLPNINFVADSAELLPGQEEVISALVEILNSVPDQSILVSGHTASVGRPEAEKNLSTERAATIAELLIQGGVEARRIAFIGKGSSEPLGDNGTPEGRARNRRVEIQILEDNPANKAWN